MRIRPGMPWRNALLIPFLVFLLLLIIAYCTVESANTKRKHANTLLSLGDFQSSREYISKYRERRRIERKMLGPLRWLTIDNSTSGAQEIDCNYAAFMAESYLRQDAAANTAIVDISLLERALDYALQTENVNWIARVYDRILLRLLHNGNRELGLKFSNDARGHVDLENPNLLPLFADHLHYSLGMNFYHASAYGDALPHLIFAEGSRDSLELLQAVARSRLFHGESLISTEGATARIHLNEAMEKFESLKESQLQARSAAGIAQTYNTSTDFTQIKRYLELAIRLDPRIEYKERLASRYIEWADLLRSDGKLEEARHAYRSAVAVSTSAEQKAMAYHGYALSYPLVANFEKRVRLLRQAISLRPDSEVYMRSLTDSYHDYALTLSVETHFETRVLLLMSASRMDPTSQGYLHSLGSTWLAKAKSTWSPNDYEKTIDILDVNEHQRLYSRGALAEAYNGLAKIAWRDRSRGEAMAYLTKALEFDLGCRECEDYWEHTSDYGRRHVYDSAFWSACDCYSSYYSSPSRRPEDTLAYKAGEWVGKQLIDPWNYIPMGKPVKWIRRAWRGIKKSLRR